MRVAAAPISHLAILINYVLESEGPVVELGIGFGSTPVLHELCRDRGLVSYENKQRYYDVFKDLIAPWHEIRLIENWDETELERRWGLAFVDQDPGFERPKSIMRLKPWADYIVVHDTNLSQDKNYHVRGLFPKFKYEHSFKKTPPNTTVLSDFKIV